MKVASVKALLCVAFSPLLVLASCDKPDAASDKPAASASAAPPPAQSAAPPPPSAAVTPDASVVAAPASSGPVKDVVASVFDPAKEPARTVKVLGGGTVALYLPEWSGTTWKIAQPDRALGKPKEETIPGFAGPSTPAHAFTWQIKDALKGQTHKVSVTNTAKGRAPGGDTSFSLEIDVS